MLYLKICFHLVTLTSNFNGTFLKETDNEINCNDIQSQKSFSSHPINIDKS